MSAIDGRLDSRLRGNDWISIFVIPAKAPVIPAQAPVIPAQAPVIPAQAPVIPAKAPVIPALAPVMPALAPVIPAKAPVIPAKAPVIPAKAGIQQPSRRNDSGAFSSGKTPLSFLITIALASTLLANPVFAQQSVPELDTASGLVIAPGFEQVRAQCTACHSGRLVAQNRADRDGWLQMIRWMQDTQNLWPLGEAEPVILDYLAANYGPLPRGRRAPLDVSF